MRSSPCSSKTAEVRSKGRSSARSLSTEDVSFGHGLRGRRGALRGSAAASGGAGGRGVRVPVSASRPGDLLEERILLELLAHDLLELEGGELQELDRLLEQRRHDDPLGLP